MASTEVEQDALPEGMVEIDVTDTVVTTYRVPRSALGGLGIEPDEDGGYDSVDHDELFASLQEMHEVHDEAVIDRTVRIDAPAPGGHDG